MAHSKHVAIEMYAGQAPSRSGMERWKDGGVDEDERASSGRNGETRPKSKRHHQRSPPPREVRA